jgi:IS1 family transposase
MNVLPSEKRAQILGCLVEGCSMRSTQRLTGAAKKTVERLLVAAGEACLTAHDKLVRDVKSTNIQLDEIWAFVGAKQLHVPVEQRDTGERGDIWTWIAIDADSKLIVSWFTGLRNDVAAQVFLTDLRSRLANRVQLTADGLKIYPSAIENVFGSDVDFAQLIKEFEHKPSGKYSPPACVGTMKRPLIGEPKDRLISTSYVERQNMTLRMSNRRFTRLTNAFSKKALNHEYSLAIHFLNYNFCRIHQTLRVTPAMAAGLTDHVWELSEIIDLLSENLKTAA